MLNLSNHPSLKLYRERVRAFACDMRGNFGVMTGLLLVPLFGFSSLAIDHWAVASAKSEIENAADAASLGAINRAAAVLRATGDKAAAIREGQAAGEDQYKGNVGKIPNTTSPNARIVVEVVGLEVKSKVEWTGVVKTTFGSLFNWSQQNLSGSSASTVTMPAYVQIHVMVDNSSSMGIGATQAAQDALFAMNHCAVACHLNGDSSYTKARAAGIKTRIDVVRDVLVSVGRKTSASVTIPKQIKIGVYTFSNDLVPLIKITDQAATDMNLFEQKMVSELGLTSVGGGTDYHGAFKNVLGLLNTISGDGTTEQKPLVYIMLVTDGVEHMQQSFTATNWQADPDGIKNGSPVLVSPHPLVNNFSATYNYQGQSQRDAGWVQPLDPNLCVPIKNKGTFSTLEIEYIIPKRQYWDHGGKDDLRFGWVKDNILKLQGNGKTLSHNRFRTCATTAADAYSAKSDTEIATAINTMFDKVIPKPPRLLK